MPLPHADTVRELRRRLNEAARASLNLQQIQVHMTTLAILARNIDLQLAPTNVPARDLVAELRANWPALDGLSDSEPVATDTVSMAISKRNTQLQLAARWLNTVIQSAHGADTQLRKLQAEQQAALETPEMAEIAAELQQLGLEQYELSHKLTALTRRHGSIQPVDGIYQTMMSRVDAELAAAARGVHYADWKAITMVRAMCEALSVALGAAGHQKLVVPPPPDCPPSPLPIDLDARQRTEATRHELLKLHEAIGAEVSEAGRLLAETHAALEAVNARIAAHTG